MLISGKSNPVPLMSKVSLHNELFIFSGLYMLQLRPHVERETTIMCLSIETPKITNFHFVPNGKLIIFKCSKI